MKDNDEISYYCFNKTCKASVYFHDSVRITDLPFTALTLTSEHYCSICQSRLVSVVDIELRQAITQNLLLPVTLDNLIVNK